jgi:hypothetical protein
MTLPVKEAPATGVLDGQDAGMSEPTLGVQPPPPPPPVETLPPQPTNAAEQSAARLAEIESERRTRGRFTVVFPIPWTSEAGSLVES